MHVVIVYLVYTCIGPDMYPAEESINKKTASPLMVRVTILTYVVGSDVSVSYTHLTLPTNREV